MKIPVLIGYYEGYLPTPRCKKPRFRTVTETVELELPEASESELVPIIDVIQDRKFATMGMTGVKPWDIRKTRVYRCLIKCTPVHYKSATAKDVGSYRDADATENPLSLLVQRLENSRDYVADYPGCTREEMIEKAKKYLEKFLLVDYVLYKKTDLPMWNVRAVSALDNNEKGSVIVSLSFGQNHIYDKSRVTDTIFPWPVKAGAMSFAKSEVVRVNADTIKYSDQEYVKPIYDLTAIKHNRDRLYGNEIADPPATEQDQKARLMELISFMPAHEGKTFEETLAEHLLANGVTAK